MFTKQFGVYSVMGNFGSWKTFWTFLEISQYPKEKNFIIANVPYKFVDVFYSKPEELYRIVDALERWVVDTNDDVFNYYLARGQYKNIVLVVDEAHLYFNARKRDKGGLMERLDILLTQCRKRNIKIFFISQRLKRVDINIRRMTDFVVRYKLNRIPILGIQRSKRTVYENEGDLADIQGDDSKTYVMNSESNQFKTDIEKSELSSEQFLPLLKIFRFPVGKRLSKSQFYNFEWEAHNSYFISGLPVEWTRTLFDYGELYRVEKPLSEKEQKIKAWIYKNLPTLVKLLQHKNKNDNGCITRPPVGCDSWGDARNAADALTTADNDNNDWLRNGSLWNDSVNVNPPKRIAGFRELREFEDRVSDRTKSSADSSAHRKPSRIIARVR